MLSSLLQQRLDGKYPYPIVDIAYVKNNGVPTTELACSFFKDLGLKIKETVYEDMSEIQYRGLARNRQLNNCDTKWILFADTDMVYDPYFFLDLYGQLENELKDEKRVISSRRVSLDKDFCKNYFNNEDEREYPCFVDNPAEICSNWPIFQISRNVGAGYFQLVNSFNVKENHGGIYVLPERNKDRSWAKGQKARSDQQFRKMMGGRKKIQTKPQYHLNHERDNEVGKHLTNQR